MNPLVQAMVTIREMLGSTQIELVQIGATIVSKWKTLLFVITVLCARLLTGCSVGPSSSIWIDYQRSGGFVGFDDHLTVLNTGEATLTRKSTQFTFTLDDATISQLQGQLDVAVFSELRREYLPERQGADLITYTIIVNGHRVKTMDGAMPEPLKPIVKSLNEIIESASGA
ncbi:MAG: hypothetical protein KDD84_17245 [Caldilineaceae bacterium]|nr:hypothetical protein [Caldilineaceae bacterium]